jgi:26S proteasome regulatory subunit N6
MILDKKFEGTLDQGSGCLIVFDEPPKNKLYEKTLSMYKSLNTVVDSLFDKAIAAKAP